MKYVIDVLCKTWSKCEGYYTQYGDWHDGEGEDYDLTQKELESLCKAANKKFKTYYEKGLLEGLNNDIKNDYKVTGCEVSFFVIPKDTSKDINTPKAYLKVTLSCDLNVKEYIAVNDLREASIFDETLLHDILGQLSDEIGENMGDDPIFEDGRKHYHLNFDYYEAESTTMIPDDYDSTHTDNNTNNNDAINSNDTINSNENNTVPLEPPFDEREWEFEHESFGVVQVSRTSSNPPSPLFASPVKHGTFITLRIYPGQVNRRHHENVIHPLRNKAYIEVMLTDSQWARMVSSIGQGSGTPCTIRSINGKSVDLYELPTTRKSFDNDVKVSLQGLSTKIKKALDESISLLLEKDGKGKRRNLTLEERENIVNKLRDLLTEFEHNLPFMQTMFSENIDKETDYALLELHSLHNSLLKDLGLQLLKSGDLQNINLLDFGK